jgi:hypothetical protein
MLVGEGQLSVSGSALRGVSKPLVPPYIRPLLTPVRTSGTLAHGGAIGCHGPSPPVTWTPDNSFLLVDRAVAPDTSIGKGSDTFNHRCRLKENYIM